MSEAILHRAPALRDFRVHFAALACVTALPFVAGAAYDIWFAMQTMSGTVVSQARTDVIEVRMGGLAIALMVSGLLAALMLHRVMPSRDLRADDATAREQRALDALLEHRVELRTRALERSIRELESHAHVVSQNLHAPLRTIDACTALIEQRCGANLDQEGLALFERLRVNARHLGRLVDALIEYSRLERRRLAVQPVDMIDVVKATVEDMHLGATDEARISIAMLPRVPADATLLSQVWRQLIDNALKFSARSTDRGVRIEGEVRHGVAEFRVSDRGAGFDPAQDAKLFNLFERLHRDSEYPGMGVGLAIVKRIVERHGGCVWAEGAPGQGASFGFALPLGAPSEGASQA